MPFSAYAVAAVTVPTAALSAYLYKMYMTITPKPHMVIKENTQPCDLNAGFRSYQVMLENIPNGPIKYNHPKNACMELYKIQIVHIMNIDSPFEESPSILHLANITIPSDQKLYDACKVCSQGTNINYQDTLLGDVSFRYPWTAAKFE